MAELVSFIGLLMMSVSYQLYRRFSKKGMVVSIVLRICSCAGLALALYSMYLRNRGA